MEQVKRLTSEAARTNWRDLIDGALAGETVIVERYGKPMVAVVNYKQWERMNQQFFEMLAQRSAEMKEGNFVPFEEVEATLQAMPE